MEKDPLVEPITDYEREAIRMIGVATVLGKIGLIKALDTRSNTVVTAVVLGMEDEDGSLLMAPVALMLPEDREFLEPIDPGVVVSDMDDERRARVMDRQLLDMDVQGTA